MYDKIHYKKKKLKKKKVQSSVKKKKSPHFLKIGSKRGASVNQRGLKKPKRGRSLGEGLHKDVYELEGSQLSHICEFPTQDSKQ